ncbi:hypothetical protein ABW21_db0201527 [Orbilia brochopaga]|nr:hypothetical protein ABW21_db0201527 [Drechslerella brochopaga]
MSLKRKRSGTTTSKPVVDAPTSVDDVFRRHFEARFGSVDLSPAAAPTQPTELQRIKRSSRDKDKQPSSDPPSNGGPGSDDASEYSEDIDISWDGIDDAATRPVEIVSYDFSRRLPPPSAKPSRSAFMSAKPPSSNTTTSSSSKPTSAKDTEEAAADAANLQNDIALRRLLSESHLLDSTLSHASARHRQQALESRIVGLGGTALSKLDGTASRTPMAIRKGMSRKQEAREEKVRTAARDSGIVLAKSQMKKKKRKLKANGSSSSSKRDRGVGGPTVGKFRRGALVLSQRDVAGMRA